MTRPYQLLPVLSLLFPLMASAQASSTPQDWHTGADLTFERIRLLNEEEMEKPYSTRRILLRQQAHDRVEEIYVAGGVSTIIHLPSALSVRGTGVGSGGAERFEVLKGDRKVVVTPTQSLAKGERFPLLVTLADGTVIPLSLTNPPEHWHGDGEVQISREPERPEELRVQLVSMTETALSLEARLAQALKEQESGDYMLAGLLAGGHTDLITLTPVKDRSFADDAGRKIQLKTYAPDPDLLRVDNQVAVVFTVFNTSAEPLELSAVRGISGLGEHVPLAFRTQPRVISADRSGQVALVLDRASLRRGDTGKVSVDFFSKARGGQTVFSVDLTREDFKRASSWWPF